MRRDPDNSGEKPNGRDAAGRFVRGNPGGKGRRPNPARRALAKVLRESVTPGDIRDIAAKLVEQAKDGDATAIRTVLDRVIGTARPEDPEPVVLPVGDITTIAGVRDAIAVAADLLCKGDLLPADAAATLRVLELAFLPALDRDLTERLGKVDDAEGRDRGSSSWTPLWVELHNAGGLRDPAPPERIAEIVEDFLGPHRVEAEDRARRLAEAGESWDLEEFAQNSPNGEHGAHDEHD